MSLLTQIIRLLPPTFKVGYCPPSPQQFANDLIGGTQATILIQEGNFLYNYGSATPAPENRVFPWFYTVDNRWYNFQEGYWVSPNPRPPAGEWIVWPNTEANLWLYDGGDGSNPTTSPPTHVSGAMWQLVTDMQGRFPLGAGDIPGTSPARTATQGTTGGEGDHSLIEAEMPPHVHAFTVIAHNSDAGGSGVITGGDNNNTNDGEFNGDTENAGGVSDGGTPPTYTVQPHNNMPPYLAVNYAVRTQRLYYALPP